MRFSPFFGVRRKIWPAGERKHSPYQQPGTFEDDDFPFLEVGYVSYLDGIALKVAIFY